MNKNIIKRVLSESEYIINTNSTVREIAKIYNVSKSTVHKDLHDRLLDIDSSLYQEVLKILKYHSFIKHIRGGQSTKRKYLM